MPLRIYFLCFFLFATFSCSKTTRISECNPESGRFIKGKHYISGNLLTEEHNWDLIAFQQYMSKQEKLYPDPDCIPISPPLSFEQKLYQILSDIDFQGEKDEETNK